MRFKISTHPPLTLARAWFPLPPPVNEANRATTSSESSQTIRDLKHHLSVAFPTVKAYGASAEEMVLEVDGFELLEDSRLVDLGLTASDIIDVKIKQGVVRAGKKRKTEVIDAHEDVPTQQSAKKRKTLTGEASRVLKTALKTTKESRKQAKKQKSAEKKSSKSEEKERRKVEREKRKEETVKPKESTSNKLEPQPATSSKKTLPLNAIPSVPSVATKGPTTLLTSACLPSQAGSKRKHGDVIVETVNSDSDSDSDSESTASSSSSSSSSASSSPSSESSSSSSCSSSASSDDEVVIIKSKTPVQGSTSATKAPQTITGNSTAERFPVLLEPKQTGNPPVPPGQGSEKTRERNLRRKLLRQAVRQKSHPSQNQTGSSSPSSVTTTRSEAPAILTGTTSDAVQLLPIPTSSANRNKNKAYMKGMEGVSGKRTVFEHENKVEGEADGYAADVSMSVQEESATPYKPLNTSTIPPSKKSVTKRPSVDTLLDRVKTLVSNPTPVTPINTRKAEPPTSIQSTSVQNSTSKSKRPHSSTRPKFTAPSSLDTLPPNMFVTSVYFPWPHGRKQGKGKDSQRTREAEGRPEEESYDTSVAYDPREGDADNMTAYTTIPENVAPSAATNPVPSLPALGKGVNHQTEREKKRRAYLLGREYISPADNEGEDGVEEELVDAQMSGLCSQVPGDAVAPAEDLETLWCRADTAWEELSVITMGNLDQLKEGSLLAWKALEMDFTTFTPEIKVKLGKIQVVKTSSSDESTDRLYQVHVLKRPDAEDVDDDVEENLAVDTASMIAGDYRLLR
ncbi:hypothetical protein QFC21_005173 [Naganishia friedmannii]|uniref:Uncharacterized protein n=1 Tax=Naganishia friedmannii TaxID=89922 RepID=A0ACC2VAP1_9TREE|nr:hypothetical protein QFC21_005173 [Naganishia friedmannii]